MKLFAMKKYVLYRLFAAFLMLAFLGSVRAQSLKTFDREVCAGASLFLDGGLYRILTNDCEITSIKANGTGPELYNGKPDNRITLTASARYHISYKDQANPGGTVAYAQITVITPPSLKITVSNPKPLPTSFCKDTKVTLNATQSNTDVYWTISSDDTYSKKGTSAEFTLTESCRITAQSYNACGFVDSSIYFPVITGPDLSNARLILNSTINGSFCMDCGFFPKAEEIVLGATQGTVKSSSITWEDGSSTEETIKAGSFSKKVKVHAVVEQSAGTCGASSTVSRTIDTVITLTVSGGKDCKPTMQTSVSVKPCRDGEVQLRNLNKGACTIQGKPTLAANPAHPKIVIGEKTPFPYQEVNSDIYRWNVRWENYAKTDAQPSLTANASYSIACPYSKSKPSITGSLTQKVNVTIDTSYLTFKYEYCPDGNADLEITGQENIVTIKDVALVGVSGGFSSMFNTVNQKKHQWTCKSVEAIKTALLDKYSPLRIKVTYEVKDGNCQFTLVREEVVNLKQRNDCNMDFELVPVPTSSQTGDCIGVSRGFRLVNADNNVVADSVVVDPHPVFTFKRTSDKMGIEPHYAGAATISNRTGNITATIYFHTQGSAQPISMTKEFELNVKSCKPELNGKIEINNNEDIRCPMCPGAVFTGVISFKNPSTVRNMCRVDFVSTSDARAGSYNKWNSATPEFVIWQYLFDDMDYRLKVTYNEGDSVYVIDNLAFANSNITLGGARNVGESATNTSIKLADICSLKTDVKQGDSVCAGEWLDLYVYSENLFEELQTIEWENKNIKPASGTDAAGREDWEYTFRYGTNLGTTGKKTIKRFHYQVQAEGSGIYAFKLQSKIRESVFERKDTIRVAILEKPRIFIQDTVYACENAGLDLWKYVDSAAVDVKTCTAPGGLVISKATDKDFRVATATLRYNCTNTTWTERITIRTDAEVYNAFIPDAAYCPGDQVELNAKTNGRVTWTRRRMLEGGGLSQADTLVANGENKVIFDDMGESSQLYTVTARTGCNQPPFQTVQFWANVKKGPDFLIWNTFACGSLTVELEAAVYDASVTGPISWKVDGQPVSPPYVVKSPDPSRDYTMKVEGMVTGTIAGVNDCPTYDTAEIRFYASPVVVIQGKNSTGTLCVDGDVSARIQAQGEASNQYAWYMKGNPATPIGTGTVLNRAFDKDTLLYVVAANGGSCTAADSVRIVLNGKKRAVADTTVCVGSSFSMSMPEQEDVTYEWYTPDGDLLCPCRIVHLDDFSLADAGEYVVEIERKGCAISQVIPISTYPVPDMDFGTTEDPVRVCAGSPLVLRMQPKIDGKVMSGYFVWTDPAGTELLAGDGKNTYVKDQALMVDRGMYKVAVTLQNGCTHSASLNVRVDEHTQPDFSLQPYYCAGDTAVLNTVYQGEGSSYEWFSESGRRLGPAADLYQTSLSGLEPRDSGPLYLVVVRGACHDTAFRDMEVRERPTADLTVQGGKLLNGELYFCEGDAAAIVLKSTSPGDAIKWTLPNGTTLVDVDAWRAESVMKAEGGKYTVAVDRNGCASEEASVNLDVRIVPVLILQDTFLCQGREVVVNVANAAYPDAVYAWRELSVQAPEVSLTAAGEYHIVMDLRGCTDEGSFLLTERPVPEWTFPTDTSICNRDSLLLQGPEGADNYLWQDGSGQTWFLVRNAGLYTLTVTDSGCANEKSVYVETEFCSPVFFPSAFTPNGDGINDAFGPISLAEEGELQYAFYVYGANGELVFRSTDIKRSWDGTFKGKPCPAGIYTYRCKIIVVESGRDLSRIGTVHLLR